MRVWRQKRGGIKCTSMAFYSLQHYLGTFDIKTCLFLIFSCLELYKPSPSPSVGALSIEIGFIAFPRMNARDHARAPSGWMRLPRRFTDMYNTRSIPLCRL